MRNDPPLAVFLTCALSHVVAVPGILQLYRRRWMFETAFLSMSMFCSFMYHTCQAFDTPIFLTELQWHRLDNIGALAGFATLFTYLSVFKDPQTEFYCKIIMYFIGIIAQERSPWDIAYTFGPILLFALVPIYNVLFVHRGVHIYEWKSVALGGGSMCCAFPFFVLGLDDDNDPYRIFHGMWHCIGGIAMYYTWRIVKQPQAIALQTVIANEAPMILADRSRLVTRASNGKEV